MNEESSMETYILLYIKQIASGNVLYDSGSSNWVSVVTERGGLGWEVGGRLKKGGGYMYTYG